MRKICFILCCLVLPLLLSCERNYYEDNLYSAQYEVPADAWSAVDDSYFSVVLDVKEITKQVCQYGSVQCFLVYDNGSQACLPLQRYIADTESVPGQVLYYQEQIDFEYSVGTVNVFYTSSDFLYKERPGKMWFRVVVHY